MSTCVQCGRELPAFSIGTPSPLCRDCNSTVTSAQPGSPQPAASVATVPSSSPFSLTKIIFGINVAVFVAMALSGISLMQPTTTQLIRWGANWGPLSLGAQPWRMFTSNYVHIGIIHILFNMWCFWNLGQLAERIFDRWTYLLVYTATGIGGSLASLWWHPLTVGAGASGAIFGLAGGLIAVLYLGKLGIANAALKPTLKSLLTFAGYNLFFGLSAGIDNAAHLGGLVTGLVLGAVLAKSISEPAEIRHRVRNFATVGIVVLLLVANTYLRQKTVKADSSALTQDPVAALNKGNFGQAIPGLKQAAEHDPSSAPTRYLLGLAYVGAHQPDAAIASFQEALRLKPDSAEAEAGLGLAYQAKGMQSEAEEAFRKAADLRKENP
jgi:membrane associated rhomboid family serine protease